MLLGIWIRVVFKNINLNKTLKKHHDFAGNMLYHSTRSSSSNALIFQFDSVTQPKTSSSTAPTIKSLIVKKDNVDYFKEISTVYTTIIIKLIF